MHNRYAKQPDYNLFVEYNKICSLNCCYSRYLHTQVFIDFFLQKKEAITVTKLDVIRENVSRSCSRPRQDVPVLTYDLRCGSLCVF